MNKTPILYARYKVVNDGLLLSRSIRYYEQHTSITHNNLYNDLEVPMGTICIVIHIYDFNAVDMIEADGTVYFVSSMDIDNWFVLVAD